MPLPRSVLPPLALLALASPVAAQPDRPASAVATGLRFVHQFGLPQALTPAADRNLKLKLIAALAKAPELTWDVAKEFFDEPTFRRFAGGGDTISKEAMERYVRAQTPQSRQDMLAKPRQHADLLCTQFDTIEEQHRKPCEELVNWIVTNYKAGEPLAVVAVCTKNTRRSMLSATMGNLAAAYHGLPNIRFFSGGTDPDAFNPRSVATLRDIGIEINPTGDEAPRGKTREPNPIYRVRWGKGLETHEFSKLYTDAHNPQAHFAAIMVCSEADTACPKVAGASARIPVPYLDPKAFDGDPFEAGKYAERRDDIGRFMLSVMMQARRRLELAGKLK